MLDPDGVIPLGQLGHGRRACNLTGCSARQSNNPEAHRRSKYSALRATLAKWPWSLCVITVRRFRLGRCEIHPRIPSASPGVQPRRLAWACGRGG
jgi:hypothetical protein